ncbi:site-specific integrase [Actinomadura rifamycini]|uniref:site-specific integrase n=1 Tax=Actinomadura rifamycini TaxID=31962 RepID=UPI00047D500B|nr:site-specific integrase [Actinomadura rifamycini]
MTKRRGRGEGGLHWDEKRQRWIASVTIGYTPAGKRIVRKASDKSKTKARDKLRKKLREYEDGVTPGPDNYTVADAVDYWLRNGLRGRSEKTVEMNTTYANNHVIPDLGARKLRDLTAEDVDKWLADKASDLSTRSLQIIHSILRRSVRSAMARDKVRRNVVDLCEVPEGRAGRPSKSLTLDQAEAVLTAAEGAALHAYVVMSVLIGARTEELRALTWSHVDLEGRPDENPPVPPSVAVWRSVRKKGDTKTRRSRRTLAMPMRCVEALRAHKARQDVIREKAGESWQDTGLVFATRTGTALSAANVRRDVRKIFDRAGLNGAEWTPREMRHSFVSLLSDSGVPIEHIARLVGHRGTAVTETVYRLQIRPVIQEGAMAMDRIFPANAEEP